MTPREITPNPTLGNLFLSVPDTELAKTLDCGLEIVRRCPDILERITADQDVVAKRKKEERLAHRRWEASRTEPLPGLTPENPNPGSDQPDLGTGRPRMPALVAFFFLLVRGHYGSVTNREALERMRDSVTLRVWLGTLGFSFPGATTVLENLNAVSNETRERILEAQLELALGEELDDFSTCIVDSTAVYGNTAWPNDGALIVKLLTRSFSLTQRLDLFGLDNFSTGWCPVRLERMRRHLFRINVARGRGVRRKRKKHYRRLLNMALDVTDDLVVAAVRMYPAVQAADLPPRHRRLLDQAWDRITGDLREALRIIDCADRRVLKGEKVRGLERIVSVCDRDAAFIQKGNREAVLGYKAQIARSENGLVTALLLPEGNAADSGQLVPVAADVIRNTGRTPKAVVADDGYASAQGRTDLFEMNVETVCITGAKGRKLTSEEEWTAELFTELRKGRSAVESTIFVLKHIFALGCAARRGREEVRAELLEKTIAHNFCRIAYLREARDALPLPKAS
jgi:hypothetical protein